VIVVTVARRPLSEGTVAANVLVHGVGAINIAATRIETKDDLNGGAYSTGAVARHDGAENWRYKRGEEGGLAGQEFQQPLGRWPANLVLEHLEGCGAACTAGCPAADLDLQQSDAGGRGPVTRRSLDRDPNVYGIYHAVGDDGASFHGDGGGAARFFKQVR
jgi:hypothetical protein